MNRFIKFFLVVVLLSFITATIPVRAASPTAALPGLSISGLNIVANGQPIRLRGVNMADPFWARDPNFYNYSLADYTTLSQTWHANVVRISIFPTQWKNMDRPTLLAGLSSEINAALDSGMYVIISYHVIGWPDGYSQPAYPGNPADTYDSSMSVATSFWTQMAQIYGADTRIIFDLWNEPVHDAMDYVGSDPNPYWAPLKAYYETLIQTVRSNGGQNIIIATGNRWASWLVGIKDNPLADSNVIYAYHKYSINGLNTPAEWDKDMGGLLGVKPVIVSEWGYEDVDVSNPTWPGSEASYGDPFTQWMDSHNLSSLAWMYHHDWTPALLKADKSLTLYGAFAQQYILANSSSSTFTDVPTTHPLYKYIQALYDAGYTAGCSSSPMMFCPDTILDRAQSAVFMLRGQMGSGYTPPAVTGIFGDNWTGFEWAQPWAEGMYQEGLTTGCQSSPLLFCPSNQLPRVEASIFGLRMKYGVGYAPPAASGTLFADFPPSDPSYWGIDWAEQAYIDGLLPACGTDSGTGKPMFCPSELVDRGWGAYLIVKAKNLPTP